VLFLKDFAEVFSESLVKVLASKVSVAGCGKDFENTVVDVE
jgi:hypothetical protein